MFGKPQKPTTAIAAPAPAPPPAPAIEDLEENRAERQAELNALQARLDETSDVVRGLQAEASKNARMGHPLSHTDPLAIALKEARDHARELGMARDAKAAELDGITKQLRAIACKPIMLELEQHVCEAAALFAQALGPNARAHACVAQLLELGAEVPPVFIRGLSIATMGPTDYSRFCDACAQAEIEIEKPPADTPSIPPPASFYFRQHDDASHAMRLAANVAGSGFDAGFRDGYLNRARNFS